LKQQWLDRPEGGSAFGYRLISGFALLCGRTAARLVLYPITLFYLLRRGPERAASRAYLQRVLQRRVGLLDVARHIYWFAAVTLDRVFLLKERYKRFQIDVTGLDDLRNAWRQQRGVLIFGAHLGSFDALRVLAEVRKDVSVRVVIDIEHNPEIFSVLNTLNPQLASSIINARRDGTTTALAIKEALDEKSLVTLLVDRARPGNAVEFVDFLGSPAPFPVGPWQLAATMKVPVIVCFGLYRGGNRYELHFEPFADPLVLDRRDRQGSLRATIQRFADRLAAHARSAPYNWFNFYDFWHAHEPPTAANGSTGTDGDHIARRA
jgi:predicted LPLAT superfamily acyltransferase